MDEEIGIYRGEVTSIMVALGDLLTDTGEILAILRDEDEEDFDEEEEDA